MEEIKINPVQIVTIKEKFGLFKGEESATNIELVSLEENGFEIVTQKRLYELGDKAIYIQPDYSLSDISLFESFLRPFGEASKSKLGSKNRVKAIKFNFHKGDGIVIYSQGILLPLDEVQNYLASLKSGYSISNPNINLQEVLGITKWEEPDESNGAKLGGAAKPFPTSITKTDETNINNLWNHIKYPITLIGSLKVDGSSITLFYNNGEFGICSRNLLKPLITNKVIGYKKPNLFQRIKRLFGIKYNGNIIEEVESDSDFVKVGKPYLDKLISYCKNNKDSIILQGELAGAGLKGSGNKNNPHAKGDKRIIFFNVCKYIGNTNYKVSEDEFSKYIDTLGFERTDKIFEQEFNSKEEIIRACESYFSTTPYKLVEGIVLRTPDHSFSCKYMSTKYDSLK